jgi:hypothetical protein
MNIEDIEEAIYEQTQEFVPQCVYKAILNLIAAERDACAELVYNSPPSDEYESPLKAVYEAIRARSKS